MFGNANTVVLQNYGIKTGTSPNIFPPEHHSINEP